VIEFLLCTLVIGLILGKLPSGVLGLWSLSLGKLRKALNDSFSGYSGKFRDLKNDIPSNFCAWFTLLLLIETMLYLLFIYGGTEAEFFLKRAPRSSPEVPLLIICIPSTYGFLFENAELTLDILHKLSGSFSLLD
jgi:hypothetical protein